MPSQLAAAQVNLYRDSTHPTPIETLSLAEALAHIHDGMYQRRIAWLRRATPDAYRTAKRHLPAMTLCGTFAPRRGIAYLQQHGGVVHGDLDHLDDVEAVKQRLAADPHVVYAFVSPSGAGLKVGIHVTPVADDAAYKRGWQAAAAYCHDAYGLTWDPSGKDISRLCYVSWDPALYSNLDAEVFDIPPTPIPAPRPPQRSVPFRGSRAYGYAERAIQTATQMIESAELGTRHHTRLRAARLLGGYIGGGLLSEARALGALMQALIGQTEDFDRALETVVDGLEYGKTHPITLDALEAARQAWIDEHAPDRHHPPAGEPPSALGATNGSASYRPYTGYRGYQPYRAYGREVSHG